MPLLQQITGRNLQIALWTLLGSVGLVLLVIIAAATTPIPRLDQIRVDAAALSAMVIVSIVTGLLFGIIPAWKLSIGRPINVLKEGALDGGPASRTRAALIVVE